MKPTEAQSPEFEGRAECYRCHKPQLTCICASVQRIANRTLVWVAQHPRERFHPIGTARIARLGLEKVHIEVVRPGVGSVPPSFPSGAGLLYPGPEARDLGTLEPAERPDALVVIDGTWAHARTIYRDNPWLHDLPHYDLRPSQESRYRLRKEPAPECVSTIEAIVEALHILEPQTPGLETLLSSFDTMIDQQIQLIGQHRRGRRRPESPRSFRGVPPCIVEEPERLVVVGFEAAPRRRGKDDELAITHCVAIRVATGETFQYFVKPPAERFPSPCHLQHMGLDPQLIETGSTARAMREAWREFIRQDDIAVAWNQTALDVIDLSVGLPERRVHLKSAYCSHHKGWRGPLGALIESLNLEPVLAAPLCGRAGAHLADIAALLEYMQSQVQHA